MHENQVLLLLFVCNFSASGCLMDSKGLDPAATQAHVVATIQTRGQG